MLNRKKVCSLLITGLTILIFSECRTANSKKGLEILGIYGSPAPLWEKGYRLDELNVNAVFLNWHSIDSAMLTRAKSEGAKVFAEFPLLNGKSYVENHPEAWPIDQSGEKAEPATWFMGVCPTEPGFREFRSRELDELLTRFDLNGIWLDYVHWHAQFEDPHPILPETCFCENCINNFEAAKGIKVPPGSTPDRAEWILATHDSLWRDWRCSIIAEWVDNMRRIVKDHDPEMLVGLYHCPWNDEEFDGAQRRILGLDYDMLRKHADVFSPMVYHARMGRSPEWVGENTEWLCRRINAGSDTFPRVWPIVQAYDEPYPVTPEEFEEVLLLGSSCSTGIMMFTTRAVAENDEKIKTMKRVYDSLKQDLR